MARFLPLVLVTFLTTTLLGGQDLGKTDRLWRLYLSESVRRGEPLVWDDPAPGVVPFWPALDQARAEARSLEPGRDFDLVDSWVDLREGRRDEAVNTLKDGWPRPAVSRFSPRRWGETLFNAWDPGTDPGTWTQAWLAWEDKAYSPLALVRGLEVFEGTDRTAVGPLLDQAVRLYPEDRRFLPLVARHPETVPQATALVARDLSLTGGWSTPALTELLDRTPGVKSLLLQAGYGQARIDGAWARDYGHWLTDPKAAPLADGVWSWDADGDGWAESRISIQLGHLDSWTRTNPEGGRWTLSFRDGQPSSLVETRDGARWTLNYEAYPLVSTLAYRWGDRVLVYRFRPLTQALPLAPAERFAVPQQRLPSVLATLWVPLDPRALALQAASIEAWEGAVRTLVTYLYRGEVWLSAEDTDRNGQDDTWNYFRSGNLVSVYRDLEGRGQASLRELYRRGELTQVQSRVAPAIRPQFVLFPQEGVQLWDPHGQGRPLDRVFVWSGAEKLDALVFQGTALPWETMPGWEPRP